MKRLPRLLFFVGLIVISVAAVTEWVISKNLRNENQVLLAELASMKSQQESESQREQKDGPEFSKIEEEELLRLRSEVGRLRIQKQELAQLYAENQRLKESLSSGRNSIQTLQRSWVSELRTNEIKPKDFLSLVQPLTEALTNSDPSVRIDIARILEKIGLERMLNTNLTAQDLSDLKSAAMAAAPGLLAALHDPDPLAHANISISLGFLRENAQDVVPALIADLRDEQWRVASAAAKSLGRFQGDALSAVPALLQAAQNSDSRVREQAIDSLKQIDPDAARNAGFE
jgi:HEAT repeat protein